MFELRSEISGMRMLNRPTPQATTGRPLQRRAICASGCVVAGGVAFCIHDHGAWVVSCATGVCTYSCRAATRNHTSRVEQSARYISRISRAYLVRISLSDCGQQVTTTSDSI